MSGVECPSCQSEMELIREPDLDYEKCTSCGGIFLDKGELNVMATGMSGDIEYCTIDKNDHKDQFNTRLCPKCNKVPMDKINLLQFSDIIFDYCTNCFGFFLDKGEIKAMNNYLISMNPSKKKDELRQKIRDYLVRLDIITDVYLSKFGSKFSVVPGYAIGNMLIIKVFFLKPLNIGLELHKEKWSAKLSKFLNLYNGQDIVIGNEEFDKNFIIRANSEIKLRKILTPNVLEKINNFIDSKKSIFDNLGNIKLSDNYIYYSEGPYKQSIMENQDTLTLAEPIIHSLIDIAVAIEN